MNVQATLKQMIEAATGAAKGKWKAMREFAEPEFRTLAQAGKQLAADYAKDLVAAAELPTAKKREAAAAKAKKRATLGFKGLRLAAEGVMLVGEADVKLAAQDALNAAIGVLRGAVNEAAGIALL